MKVKRVETILEGKLAFRYVADIEGKTPSFYLDRVGAEGFELSMPEAGELAKVLYKIFLILADES